MRVSVRESSLPMLDKLLQGGEGGCSESVYNMAKAMALEGNNILMARIRAGSFYKRLACTEGVDPDVLYDWRHVLGRQATPMLW